MQLSSPAAVFDVADPDTTRDFLTTHLGFAVSASGEDFIALGHDDIDMRVIVRALPKDALPKDMASSEYQHLFVGFLVTGIDEHWDQLKDAVTVTDPISTVEAIGERSFEIADANGIPYRLIEYIS